MKDYLNAPLQRRKNKLCKYGLTERELAAMEAIRDGCCDICGQSARLIVDHCHKTSVVRGLICQPCNVLIGRKRDRRPEWFLKAYRYLCREVSTPIDRN
jgi:hypothetical protein